MGHGTGTDDPQSSSETSLRMPPTLDQMGSRLPWLVLLAGDGRDAFEDARARDGAAAAHHGTRCCSCNCYHAQGSASISGGAAVCGFSR